MGRSVLPERKGRISIKIDLDAPVSGALPAIAHKNERRCLPRSVALPGHDQCMTRNTAE